MLDPQTGRILGTVAKEARCTRFNLADPYLLGSNLDVYDLSDPKAPRRISSGPRVDISQCVATLVSNGRMFYTAQGAGLQISQVYGDEAAGFRLPWDVPGR